MESIEEFKLKALGISLPVPKGTEILDEGFMETDAFRERVRQSVPYAMHPLGAFERHPRFYSGGGNRCICFYFDKAIENNFPVNVFVRGHEETHILQPNLMNRRDLLKNRLDTCGIDSDVISFLEKDGNDDEIADAGGLFAMYSAGVPLANYDNADWQRFLKDFERSRSSQFEQLVELFLWSKKGKNNTIGF